MSRTPRDRAGWNAIAKEKAVTGGFLLPNAISSLLTRLLR